MVRSNPSTCRSRLRTRRIFSIVSSSADSPFQCVILALDGDHHGIGGGQRVHREHVQSRRTVDDDVVVVFAYRVDRIAQPELAPDLVEQPHFCAGEVGVGRGEGVATVLGRGSRSLRVSPPPSGTS